ncbi:MAG TPA: NAD(P)(+) transhydrogenase (Re/Si-specific) subunit beta [Pirellulales bacterium]|nr:NAD(P)(+) transhydrogenase (Re/Si-specific) subunit beta [Pirellulales bacterium]
MNLALTTSLFATTGGPASADPRVLLTQASYLAASVLFILGLKGLTNPDKARRGMQLAALGMALAVVGTLIDAQIISYTWIVVGMILGSAIGAAISIWMPMTAVPQRTAISHAFGALAATMVGIAHFHEAPAPRAAESNVPAMTVGTPASPQPEVAEHSIGRVEMAALGFEVLFGSLTITGSFMAFGKLQGFVPSQPITYKGQNASNISLFVLSFLLFVYLIFNPAGSLSGLCFYLMIAIGLAVGVLIVLPIGGADMPVVISLLNSYAGLASSATGFALHNSVLIIAGALDGASGFLLSILMSKAMNRSFTNVLFGAFGGGEAAAGTVNSTEGLTVHSISVDDAGLQLAYARLVIVVPGYGMAVAQAQHQVRELAELIEKRGGEVKYAIHPVAGRMPGHMNVLLAEANVPYDRLYDMEDINNEFARADVALIIGANDVVNPAARNDPASPIYGMPILNADQAQRIIVLKRSMNPGFSGIENELFYNPKTALLFGDAKSSLTQLVTAVKNL